MDEAGVKSFSSARSGRVYDIALAPPLLIYLIFSVSILLQVPVSYVIHHLSFTFGMLLNQVGTLLVPVLISIRVFGLTTSKVLPFKKVSASLVLLSIVMIFSLAVITDYLVFVTEWALPVTKSLNEVYKDVMSVSGVGSYMHKFLILCILPSVCEEIFFRGFCQTGLERYYGRNVGILIAAAIFAVAHLSPWYTHLYFILGIFLGWIFAVTRSLWIPIICHIVNNTWTFTSHVMGWHVPLKTHLAWVNVPILIISFAVLGFGMWVLGSGFWDFKKDDYRNHGLQSPRRP